jgi:hypothetical protein
LKSACTLAPAAALVVDELLATPVVSGQMHAARIRTTVIRRISKPLHRAGICFHAPLDYYQIRFNWKDFDERRSGNGTDNAAPFDPPIKRRDPAG